MAKIPRQTFSSALTLLRRRPVVRVIFLGEYCGKIHTGLGQAAKEMDLFLDDLQAGGIAEEERPMPDGLLLVCTEACSVTELLKKLGKRMTQLPVEVLWAADADFPDAEKIACSRPDWAAAGTLLARHVQALQLPHVACWRRRKSSGIWRGFAREWKRLGGPAAAQWDLAEEISSGENAIFSQDAHAWLLRQLALLPRPGVVVTEDDHLAYLVVMAARRLHLRVPEHISVIGVGDREAVQDKSPVSLSSVEMNWARLGYLALRRLAKCLTEPVTRKLLPPQVVAPQGVVERASTRQFYSEDEAVARTVQRIRRDFAQPLSVKILAREAGISAPLLHARYTKVTGSTMMKTLREIRLAAAAERLREGDLKLESVADETGLGDVRNLFRLFKEHYGVTPTQYRDLHQHPEEGLNTLLGLS